MSTTRNTGWRAIERHPWDASALGPMRDWPASLRGAVDLMLALPCPASVLWGRELVLIPNRPFASLWPGPRAPLGCEAVAAWPQEWPGGDHVWSAVRGGDTVTRMMESGRSLVFSALRGEDGDVAGILVIIGSLCDDVEVRRSRVHHERRNAVAWVRSIAKRTALTSVDVDDFLMHLDGRVDVFSRVDSAMLLYSGGIPLASLVASELLAAGAQEDEALKYDGPDVMIDARAARTVALALHELATNAVKFGALGIEGGRIAVRWRVDDGRDGRRLIFEWIEDGLPAAPQLTHRGFGFEVLERTVVYEFGAETVITAEAGGIHVTIDADWTRLQPTAGGGSA